MSPPISDRVSSSNPSSIDESLLAIDGIVGAMSSQCTIEMFAMLVCSLLSRLIVFLITSEYRLFLFNCACSLLATFISLTCHSYLTDFSIDFSSSGSRGDDQPCSRSSFHLCSHSTLVTFAPAKPFSFASNIVVFAFTLL